ncbi:MAG: hypothetical protein IJK23_11600 [Clostridia bacterium]|nr:hypothetical protein [Clostridia bacterium]
MSSERNFQFVNGLRPGARYDAIFYGAYAGVYSWDMRVRFDFKQRLNRAKLQKAADAALELYPEFKVRPVVKDGKIFYEENFKPVRLRDDDDTGLYFGTDGEDGTNGYLFVFLCGERHLTFSLYHGLTDAHGMIAYIATVLWEYVKLILPFARLIRTHAFDKFGLRVDKKSLPRMSDLERYDPLTRFAGEGTFVDLIDKGNLFLMPPEQFDRADRTCRLVNLEISNAAFLEKTRELHTSFAPLLAALTAEAVDSLYDIGDKMISVITTVDSRRLFSTQSLGNMAYNCPLPVTKADLGMPTENLCAKLKEDMKKQITVDHARAMFSFILGQCNDIDGMGDVVAVNDYLTGPNGLKGLTTNGTIFLTYPGRVDNNPISKLLLNGITPGMLAMERAINVYAHRDSLIIQLSMKSDDMTLVNALRETLKKHGFDPRVFDMGRITQNMMDLHRLKTVPPEAEI